MNRRTFFRGSILATLGAITIYDGRAATLGQIEKFAAHPEGHSAIDSYHDVREILENNQYFQILRKIKEEYNISYGVLREDFEEARFAVVIAPFNSNLMDMGEVVNCIFSMNGVIFRDQYHFDPSGDIAYQLNMVMERFFFSLAMNIGRTLRMPPHYES